MAATDRAFVGRVVAVRSGRDAGGLPSTWVTFSVTEALAGRVAKNITIKQLGTIEPLSDGTVLRLSGLPSYQVGEELVLFLSGESAAGFSSPIGLEQGKYPIVREGNRAFVTGAADSAAPSQPPESRQALAARKPAAVELTEFLSLVRRLVAERANR